MSGSGGAAAAASAALSPRARALIAAGLVGLLLGFLWGVADVPRYTASATVLISGGGAPAEAAELAAATELAAGAEVADRAAGLLGGDVAGADLLSEIDATADPSAGAVRIEAEADSPDIAAAAANGYAAALVDVGGKRYSAGGAAAIPGAASEDRSALLWSLLGLLAGLLAAAAAVAIAGRRGRAPRPEPETEPAPGPESAFRFPAHQPEPRPAPEPAGAAVLAQIADPAALVNVSDGVVTIADADADAFADLAAELRLADPDQAPRRLALLEPAAGVGALAVVIGLAITAAELGRRVIVVEADLDEPALARRIGVAPVPGLREYLRGSAGPRDVLRRVPVDVRERRLGLVSVPAGDPGPAPPEGIGGDRFAALIGRLPRAYDLVLISGPAIDRGPDAAAIARLSDAVVLVAEAAGEARSRAAEALAGTPLIGLVLTAQSGGQSSDERSSQRDR